MGVYIAVLGTLTGTGVSPDLRIGAVVPAVVVAAVIIAYGLLPKEPTPRAWLRFATGAISSVVVGVILGFAGVPAWITAQTYDGTLSSSTLARGDAVKCSSPHLTGPAYSWPVSRRDGSLLGTEEVVYSPQCRTAWAKFVSDVRGVHVIKTIRRPAMPLLTTATTRSDDVVGRFRESFGPQVYAPGCVSVTLRIVENGQRIDTAPTRTVCGLALALAG